jgi:uncharacterized phage protein
MPSITSLINKLKNDYPEISFTGGDEFRWSPTDKTVIYQIGSDDAASLLHEVAHSLLHHISYNKDLQLLEMEREAWLQATGVLAPAYEIAISDETVDTALDSYRDWLHARSTCPECKATGIQTKQKEYKCVACHTKWRVNEARVCELRRYVQYI